MLICFLTSIFLGSFLTVTIIPLFSFLYLVILQKNELKVMIPWGGYANYITAGRLLILMSIGIIHSNNYFIFVFGLISILLDGVDGIIARKFNQVSKTGAIFDLEVDALYVLIVSLLVSFNSLLPLWILIPAVMRYVFIIIANMFNLDLRRDKRTILGPAIAGLHFVALLLPFIIPQKLYLPICAITSGMVILSFLFSFFLIIKKE